MGDPKRVPGTLYVNRDRDFRTQLWGPYVKIGIVRQDRTAEARNKEHQTGNPREVVTVEQLESPMVEHLETQLHHRFATRWVSGEWFEMEQTFVRDTLLPEARQIIDEQHAFFADFESKAALKSTESTGQVRTPTSEETEVYGHIVAAKEALNVAKAVKELADLKLRELLGTAAGVDGIIHLQQKSSKPVFDRRELEKSRPDLHAEFWIEKPDKISGSPRVAGFRSLKNIDEDLSDRLKQCRKNKSKISPQQAKTGRTAKRSADAMAAHATYVASLAAVARAEWDSDRWTARLLGLLGKDESIEDQITWKRALKSQGSFDTERFKQEYPDLYAQYLRPESHSVAVDIHSHRPYPLAD